MPAYLDAPEWTFYNSCDGDHLPKRTNETNEEIRKVPYGGGNLLLCYRCHIKEMNYRRMTGGNYSPERGYYHFGTSNWYDLEIVEPALAWIEVSEKWYDYSLCVLPPIYGPIAGVFAVDEPVDHIVDTHGKLVPTYNIYAEHATKFYGATGTIEHMMSGKIIWRADWMRGR